MSRINSILIIHAVRIPSLNTVLHLNDLDAVALGKGGRDHVLTGSTGILAHLILSIGLPVAEGTYEIDTVVAYGCGRIDGSVTAADIVESYFIFALAVEIGHVNAGRAGKGNVNGLRRTVGDDVVGHALGQLEGESLFTEFVLTDRGHRNAGPLYRHFTFRPVVDINRAKALVVRENDGSVGGIGSRNRLIRTAGTGAVGSPTCYQIMTLIVLRTVHPVTIVGKVSDVLGLSAVAVAQDHADSVLGNIALELSLTVIIRDSLCHSGAGPFACDCFAGFVPSVDIRLTPTEVVGQEEGRLDRIIGSGIVRTAGTVGVPTGDLVMTQIVLGAIHPVTVIGEVLDVLGLFAVTVAQDHAGSALGNVASELSLAVLIRSGLSLSGTRPCAVKLIAVIVPSIDICLTPTEVVGEEEGALGIGIRIGTGIGSRVDRIEFYIVVTFRILIGHVNTGRAIERNVNSLLAAVVDDIVGHAGGDLKGESLFAVFIHTDRGHRNAGPLNGLLGIRPIVNINSAEALVVREDDRAALTGIRLSGIIGNRRRRDDDRGGGLFRLYGLFLTDVILDGSVSKIALDQCSVDNGNKTVTVNVSRAALLIGKSAEIDRITQDQGSIDRFDLTVAVYITEDVGLGRISGLRRIGGLGSLVILIENRNAGRADRTLDLRLGNGKGVAGDGILIGTCSQFVVRQSDVLSGGTAEVDDHRTGRTSLNVSGAVGVRAVLRLTDEVVMELVDRLGGSVGPRGLARFTDLDIIQIVGVGVVGRTSKVYGRDTRTTGNQRPDLTTLSGVQRGGSAVNVSIMGLIPQHGVRG